MKPEHVAGVVLGGALLIIVVMALLDVARRKWQVEPIARLSNAIYPPPT